MKPAMEPVLRDFWKDISDKFLYGLLKRRGKPFLFKGWFMDIKFILQSHGIRPSLHRMAVYKYLMEERNHPSADIVYRELHKSIPTLSKTTVYNILKLFIEHGLVKELFIERGESRFDGDISLHSHFICNKCGRIFDFFPEKEQLGNLMSDFLPEKDFVVNSFQITISGSCGCNL